ncbi:MAG: alpha/beta hydrolase [Chitinophagales bacterium]
MQKTGFLQYQNSQIHYLQFGTGDKILFAFHGFSENGNSFFVLEESLGKKYTVVAIDLPFHGETQWNEMSHFTNIDLENIIRLFIGQYKQERFSVLGFSMGGKCALYVVKFFAPQIDELFLMASDGIKTNKIYNVAVYPKWGRELFKTTINHPGWLFTIVKVASKLKILSPWLKKFTEVHMETKEKRERLYNTWISMAQFNPDITLVKEKINANAIKTYLFFGIRDEVIPVSVGESFAMNLKYCSLTKLERGHYFIDAKLNTFITNELNAQ